MEARIRAWPDIKSDEPRLLAHAGFKAGCIQIVSIDDHEHTPNHGKQLVTIVTVIVTPPFVVIGIRGYSKDVNGLHASFDVYAKDTPKNVEKAFKIKVNDEGIYSKMINSNINSREIEELRHKINRNKYFNIKT